MDKWILWVGLAVGAALLMLAASGARRLGHNSAHAASFDAIALGTGGGLYEGNLSAFLLAPSGSSDFVALDAGNLLTGIRRAAAAGGLRGLSIPNGTDLALEGWMLQHIKAYLLSHAHLDHVAGLIVNSPDDAGKEILALPETIDVLRDHLFNWKVWPNFGNEGVAPLNKYHYIRLQPGVVTPISGTAMTVEAFPLSHSGVPGEGPYTSTAFLIQSGGHFVLFVGDTGPDAIEGSDHLKAVWQRVAPLVREGRLRGIFLEVSYPNGRPDNLLFGHLTPAWMLEELRTLALEVDADHAETALRGLQVVVIHIKPSFKREEDPSALIAEQLEQLNELGLRFILPQQGQRIRL